MTNDERMEFDMQVEKRVREILPQYLQTSGFMTRKLTDTPTDGFQVVSRNYVNMNGVTASRPRSSILGQQYFDTSLGIPVWWNGTAFVDATGSVV